MTGPSQGGRAAVRVERCGAADLDIGHTDPIAPLSYGALAEIDRGRATLAVLEAAVA